LAEFVSTAQLEAPFCLFIGVSVQLLEFSAGGKGFSSMKLHVFGVELGTGVDGLDRFTGYSSLNNVQYLGYFC
jgi:hypothetical protein